jgi:hypothetical protein
MTRNVYRLVYGPGYDETGRALWNCWFDREIGKCIYNGPFTGYKQEKS